MTNPFSQHPNLLISVDDVNGIISIQVQRAPINSITLEMIQSMIDIVHGFINGSFKVLLISGSGAKYFIGGAELDQISSISDGSIGANRALLGQRLCHDIYNSPKPIIASINGDCLGGGNEIATACHLRISSSHASFQQPEVHLGIIPGFGGTQFLPRLVGESAARRLILSCEKIGADEALRIGLVDIVVEPDALMAKTNAFALNLCSKSQNAIRAAHLSISNSQVFGLEDGLKKENELFRSICDGKEMREAISAFREKRRPNFK